MFLRQPVKLLFVATTRVMIIMMTTVMMMMIPVAVRCLAGVFSVVIPLQVHVEVYHLLVHFFYQIWKKNVFHFFVKMVCSCCKLIIRGTFSKENKHSFIFFSGIIGSAGCMVVVSDIKDHSKGWAFYVSLDASLLLILQVFNSNRFKMLQI